ncbi:MAG: MaoC family dehydratase [Desulfarculales bacterium]|jgi:acyl dehydratase|nr:MaoC family dehydratase [Desulfarculales bacterium]
MSQNLFLEDLYIGKRFDSGRYLLDKKEIISFASEYDPQPFHTDPEKSEKLFFRGHSASGWQTAAVTMRLLVSSVPLDCGVIGVGADLTWLRPVRPGDELQVTTEVQQIHISQTKQDRAIVTWLVETKNQKGETVQTMTSKTMVFSKNAP